MHQTDTNVCRYICRVHILLFTSPTADHLQASLHLHLISMLASHLLLTVVYTLPRMAYLPRTAYYYNPLVILLQLLLRLGVTPDVVLRTPNSALYTRPSIIHTPYSPLRT